ncbi:biogenesis of lysosome-related organelles complex-1 subunit 2-like [Ptychodera flava]|uniref:biogenesis of lysosome-related organelles complex-1 subunit 2-like n=1 Tax=Ptychodera flava TaxID=63121 RepID=UPI00396AA6BF
MADVAVDTPPPSAENAENKGLEKKEDESKVPKNTEGEKKSAPADASKPDANKLCQDMFMKLEEYLKGDLAATAEDYKLLEKMNRLTIHKYSEMKQMTSSIATSMQTLNEKYKSLQPYLDQIDQVEESVANLEQAAYRLDAYSKRLETKFKQLEKR